MTEMFADEDAARFFQMVQMLQRSTLLQMGYLPDQSGTYHYNMGEAREGIEVLRMFQRKTEGNLSSQETQMLRAVISELQMQFTQAPQRKRTRDERRSAKRRDSRNLLSASRRPRRRPLNPGERRRRIAVV